MKSLLFSFFLATLFGCGSDGDRSGGRKNPPPDNVEDEEEDGELGLRTTIGLNGLSYEFPFLTSCMKRNSGLSIYELSADWAPDGDLEEWTSATAVTDPLGDSLPAVDIAAVYVGKNEHDLGIAVLDQGTPGVALVLEIGGIVIRDKNLQPEIMRLIRINGPQVEEMISGAWVKVGLEDVSLARVGPVTEIRMTRRFLGESVAHPSWWLRVASQNDEGMDSTFSAFYPSLINGDVKDFVFAGCQVWTTQPKPFSMIHLQDSSGAAPDYPMNSVAERAFQLTRLAFDAVHALSDEISMPFDAATVIATLAEVDQTVQKIDGVGEEANLFGPLRINVASLGPTAVDAFPQGRVFSQGVIYFLEAYLFRINPNMNPLLRLAVANALLNKAQTKFLTESYFLDYFGTEIQDFLKLETNSIGPLTKGSVDEGLARQKARAFGHLLSSTLSKEQLIDAWKTAALIDSEEPFAAAFGEFIDPQVIEDGIWDGWINKNAYSDTYSPKILLDSDQDGLADLIERNFQSNAKWKDTDQDGWSDYSEFLLGVDANSSSAKPSVIVPDGSFDDWFTLFPQRVYFDEGKSTACPTGADITHYAALSNRDQLIIAAHAKNYDESDSQSLWQAMITVPSEDKSILAVAKGNSRTLELLDPKTMEVVYRMQRAMPMGNDTVEWVIDRQQTGFKTYFNKPEDIRVQILTGYESEQDGMEFCDQTPWFAPYVYASEG